MYSKVQICNLAIQTLGGNPISSLSEDSKEAQLCNAFFDIARDSVLSEHDWGFAKKWAALAVDADATILDERFTYAYKKPNDFIRLVLTGDQKTRYVIRGNDIMSNVEDLSVEYIYRIEDVSKFPIHFIYALAARLRAEISIPLTKKGSMVIDWYQVYNGVLTSSIADDAQQDNPLQKDDTGHTNAEDTWLNSRSF